MPLIAELHHKVPTNVAKNCSMLNNKYTSFFDIDDIQKEQEYIGVYTFHMDNNWDINIEIKQLTDLIHIEDNFFGYEWMLDSIRKYKEIRIQKGWCSLPTTPK